MRIFFCLIAFVVLMPVYGQDQDRIDLLINRLGDQDFKVRESATQELIQIGSAAMPSIELATKSEDAEVAFRAKRIMIEIDRSIQARKQEPEPPIENRIPPEENSTPPGPFIDPQIGPEDFQQVLDLFRVLNEPDPKSQVRLMQRLFNQAMDAEIENAPTVEQRRGAEELKDAADPFFKLAEILERVFKDE